MASTLSVQAQKEDNPPLFIAAQFDEAYPFSEGLAVVRIGQKFGVIDNIGRTVAFCKYDQIEPFSEGRAVVRVGDKYGYIDTDGKEVIAPDKYVAAWPYRNGLALVVIDQQRFLYGYIDMDGNTIVPFRLAEANSFSEGIAIVKDPRNEYCEMLKYTGGKDYNERMRHLSRTPINGVTTCRTAGTFHDGIAKVQIDRYAGFINTDGKMVLPAMYDAQLIGDFNESLCPIAVKGKGTALAWGYIDTLGDTVVACRFAEAYPFQARLAAVRDAKSGKMGFIGMDGSWRIKPQYDGVRSFSDSYAVVVKNNKYGFINIEGDVMVAPRYDDAKSVSEGLAPVRVGNKWGYIKLF